MMKRFLRFLAGLVLLIPFWGVQQTTSMAADCGAGVSTAVRPGDLAAVLFVVSGNQAASDIKGLDPQAIRDDISAALSNAGIQAEVTGQPEGIRADRFLKVHIYSILLDRQVYFSSVAVIQRQSSGGECVVVDHSEMTSNPGNIRSQMKELLESVLRDVR